MASYPPDADCWWVLQDGETVEDVIPFAKECRWARDFKAGKDQELIQKEKIDDRSAFNIYLITNNEKKAKEMMEKGLDLNDVWDWTFQMVATQGHAQILNIFSTK